jgi:acetyl-CoA carboxylase biotin carboxylase subunit
MVFGVDLVASQLILAATGVLPYTPDQIKMHGAAIEVRVLAEDPDMGFIPATGEINYLKEPGGPGIRVDSALYMGMPVTTNYDSLIAKVIAWGEDRDRAIRRLRRAIMEFQIGGVPTDIDFLLQIMASESFIHGRADTTYLDTFKMSPMEGQDTFEKEIALAAVLLSEQEKYNISPVNSQATTSYWQMTAWKEQMRS